MTGNHVADTQIQPGEGMRQPLQQVFHLLRADGRLGHILGQVIIPVGRPHRRHPLPGDEAQLAPVARVRQRDPGRQRQPFQRKKQVRAGLFAQQRLAAQFAAQPVAPRPGGVDHNTRQRLGRPPFLALRAVAQHRPAHLPARVDQQVLGARVIQRYPAVGHTFADQAQHQAGIVHPRARINARPAQPGRAQVRRQGGQIAG